MSDISGVIDERQQKPISIFASLKNDLYDAGRNLIGKIAATPSWLDRATEQSKKDQEAFQQGGVKGLMADTTGGIDLAGGFGGTTIGRVRGLSLATKPPLIGGYHGTDVPIDFQQFKAFPDRDLGVHYSPNPDISSNYTTAWTNNPGPRTVPVVGDINRAFRFPTDAVKWNDPNIMIPLLEDSIRARNNFPLSLLTDVESAAKQSGGLKKNLIPMWQEKGFDSLIYPHAGSKVYDSIMAFDPKQVMFKFSDEAKELAKERGIHNPISRLSEYGHGQEPWRMPAGIMKKYADVEPGQGTILEARAAARNVELQKASKNLDETIAKYHAGEASLDDYKVAHNKYHGPNTYEDLYGPGELPAVLSPIAAETYKIKAMNDLINKQSKEAALKQPAPDYAIKTWGLKPGATNKDLNEAIARWAETH